MEKSVHLAIIGATLAPALVWGAFEPAPYITRHGLGLIPFLSIQQIYDSNVYRDNTDQQTDWLNVIDVGLAVQADHGPNRYRVSLAASQGNYFDQPLDFTDFELDAQALLEFSVRNRLDFRYRFSQSHDEPGTRLTEGIGATLDEMVRYQNNGLGLTYGFGAPSAMFGWELFAEVDQLRYDSLSELTDDRDLGAFTLGSALNYQWMPATTLFIEFSQLRHRYLASERQDSDTGTLLLGARWQLSDITDGTLKLGLEQKRFIDKPDLEAARNTRWQGTLRWRPRSYSLVTLKTVRLLEDPIRKEDYRRRSGVTVAWSHAWLERLSSTLDVEYTFTDYVGISREDHARGGGLEMTYDMRRWFQIGAGYRYSKRGSSEDNLDHDRNTVFINVRASL